MSAQQTKAKRHALQETPVTEITGIKDTCPVVVLKIFRRAPNGTLATIDASVNFDTLQLLDGTIEKYLEAKAGGGTFTVEARDPADPSIEVLPRFLITLPGAPKDPRHVPQQAVQQAMYGGGGGAYAAPVMPGMPMQQPPGVMGIQAPPMAYQMPGVAVPQYQGPGQVSLPPAEALPPWARGFDAGAQWKLYYQALEQSGRLPAGSSIHSDALASQHASTWQAQASGERAENAKLREKLESMEARRAEEAARYQKEVENLRVQQEAQKREGEMAALRSEIAALRDSRESRGSGIEWGTVIAAGVPIVSALVGFLSERARADALMQVETRKLEAKQQESMLMLMAPKDNGSLLDKVMPLLPAIAPIITKFMENNGTLAQAELIEMRNNGQMMQIKMLHDMIQDLRNEGEPPPPWMPALEGILGAVQGYAQMKGMQQQQQGANGAPPQRKVAAPLPSVNASDAEIWKSLAQIDAQAAQATQMVWNAIPGEFHTQEWRVLIFNIHARTAAAEVAENLVDYLAHLQRYEMLPPALADVFNDSSSVEAIVMALPIARVDQEYTETLIAAVKQLIEEASQEEDEGEEEDPGLRAPIDVHEVSEAVSTAGAAE